MESPVAILDQENTLLAIDEFNRFIDNYPQSPLVSEAQKKIEELTAKLAHKEYLNAELYKKQGHYESALIYYRDIIDKYPRTVWADYSILGIGDVFFKQQEYSKAKEMFVRIINDDVEMELKKRASLKLQEIENLE
jgi:outer membrane protein assembly factor BamD